MSQDKEYIPEWKQPHIGSQNRFITFAVKSCNYAIRRDLIGSLDLSKYHDDNDGYTLEVRDQKNKVMLEVCGSFTELSGIYHLITIS